MEGNQMKMREALEQAYYFLRRHHMGAVYASDGETLIFCEEVIDIVDKALSAPPRNCDVGTAEEQAKRYDQFCEETECSKCPVHAKWRQYFDVCKHEHISCGLIWAQMPYEAQEEGAK